MNDAIIIRMENAEQLAMGQLELKVTLTVEKNYVYRYNHHIQEGTKIAMYMR